MLTFQKIMEILVMEAKKGFACNNKLDKLFVCNKILHIKLNVSKMSVCSCTKLNMFFASGSVIPDFCLWQSGHMHSVNQVKYVTMQN